jgi:hypothetical protein
MRQLNCADYQVAVKELDPDGQIVERSHPFAVKDSMLNLLFHPGQGLNGAELIKHQALALKIEACKADVILLEESEWERLKAACETFRGFERASVELVLRIMNAPQCDYT